LADIVAYTPLQTRFINLYDRATCTGEILPWVTILPREMRAADRGLIVDPSAIADRPRRKASQSAASGAPAMIDAPAAIADRPGNNELEKFAGIARRAGGSQRAMVHACRTGYRLGAGVIVDHNVSRNLP
jgi:hypothetical protein